MNADGGEKRSENRIAFSLKGKPEAFHKLMESSASLLSASILQLFTTKCITHLDRHQK